MKRRFAALLCLVLLWAQVGLAEEIAAEPGVFSAVQEEAALSQGLELRTETSFDWGGLPLLDEATDKALGSLLDETGFVVRRQQVEGNGYTAWDMLLQDVSVLDLAMQVTDGVYYEQSNLTGGETLAFTPEEFQTFVGRLSMRSQSVIPPNLDALYAIVTQVLTGTDAVQLDAETIDGAMAALDDWKARALTETDRLRPKVSIPGLYGLRATIIDVTRNEALELANAYIALLEENETLWRDVILAQAGPDADETTLSETILYVSDILHELPQQLEDYLTAGLAPTEYRVIYGPDDEPVARQLDITLPDDVHFYLEWVPEEMGVPAFYLTCEAMGASLELLVTQERGTPEASGKITTKKDRTIAQMTYIESELQLDVVMTRTENAEQRTDKEVVTVKTDWMMESEAIFGDGAVITLTSETTRTASGEGKDYALKSDTLWRLKGLGFDDREILKVTSRTQAAEADAPVDLTKNAVRPAGLEEEAFDAWLADVQVSMMQAGFTVLGRLPADVAAYILAIGR